MDRNRDEWRELTNPDVVRERTAHAVAGGDWPSAQSLYTAGWRDAVNQIPSGDPTAIEAGIVFLEVNPWCLFSGYEKDVLYRALARAPLSEKDGARLRIVVLERLRDPRGRSRVTLRALAHLANAVWTPDLQRAMAEIPRSPVPRYAEHERLFLHHAEHGHQTSVHWGTDHSAEGGSPASRGPQTDQAGR